MAEDLLETVDRLQSRLLENPEPRKLLKTLKRLGELPMTVDILVETGVGKIVNSFRKHQLAGEVAKGLVAKWKKLVPQSADRPTNSHINEAPRSHNSEGPEAAGGHRRTREPSPEEESSIPLHGGEATKMSSDRGGGEGEAEADEGRKRSADRERQQSPSGNWQPRAPRETPPKQEDDDFETPTMSFESFLTYDAPTPVKKKKKPSSSSSSSHSRPSHSSSTSSSHRSRSPPPTPTSSSKGSKANGTQSSKRQHSGSSSASTEKRKRAVEIPASLPEIPLPAIQPNYRPLPSLDVTPLSPQRRKVPVSNDEEDSGFTGKRFNSKMTVYSGSKTAYLPRMMTLYEQCIRVLQNNIDSIAEVGGVPFEILEPVLERGTPEQLYRIEQSNQWFTEESDELWMRHCQRDFKRESPQEYESWREMYLRLHDEREERLRMLTQNISSAHANKPKGRQVKMAFVNSVAKPPRDVRRRQEKFGTISGSSASSTSAAAPIKIRPATINYSAESMRSSSSQFNPSAGDKPQVKKIAPMMAKTIKAFKNRFSRR
ncbi:Elongin-A [Dissostichus eleginoides]|uniref:Elongin-A n=1 Tax=Dissostichus eleginoides TaxID=100907 RepID=A0AAD9BB31_DISEL|nr:Elongin-A [Dissostichus eleginoides]